MFRLLPAGAAGLYRIRAGDGSGLLYIGEGTVRSRLRKHLGKISTLAHPQGIIFGGADQLWASWVLNRAWHDHQRLELENDLTAAHILETGRVPTARGFSATALPPEQPKNHCQTRSRTSRGCQMSNKLRR